MDECEKAVIKMKNGDLRKERVIERKKRQLV